MEMDVAAGLPNGIPTEAPITPNGGAPANPNPAGTPAAPVAAPAPWYGDIADPGVKGYAELKAWKSPEDAIKAAQSAEKLIGVPRDELLRLPKDLTAAKPEELDAIYTRLGRPAAATDYKLPEIPGGEEFRGAMAPLLHSAGLNQAQASKLAEGWNAYMSQAVEAQQREQAQREQVDLNELHKEWPGEVYTQREEMARRAVREFVAPFTGGDQGKTAELLGKIEDAVGTGTFLRLFSGIGERVGEAKFVGSGASNSSFGMTPAAADARIKELMGDREWGRKVLDNPKGPEGLEWERLQKLAVGGR